MKRTITSVSTLICLLGIARIAQAHCEVPCGIYADQRRFEQMLEDCDTIAKAIKNMHNLSTELAAGEPDPQLINQIVRWTNTKEAHATATQQVVSQYFLTQRIKPGSERYVEQLKAAHSVLIAAMKNKQKADPKTAETLRESILDLYRSYTGKEPQFEKE